MRDQLPEANYVPLTLHLSICSDRQLRNQLKLLAADSMGKRERRAPPTNYNPVVEPKKSMVVNNRKIKLPKALRLPRMEDHQFFNRERLLELSKIEFKTFATLKQSGQLPPREVYEDKQSVLPDDIANEKLELLNEGFDNWTKSQYFHFVKAATKFGRTDITSIAADMDLPVSSVAEYSEAFWLYGPTELKEEEWERALGSIEKGEAVSSDIYERSCSLCYDLFFAHTCDAFSNF